MRLVKTENDLEVRIRRKGPNDTDDTLEPLKRFYEEMPELLKKLLERRSMPMDFPERAWAVHDIKSSVCDITD